MNETYQCPGCGAPLVYQEGSEFLICPYCGTKAAVADIKKKRKTPEKKTQDTEKASAGDTAVFHCTSCGGELMTDAYTAATTCPFCGSPVILQERLEERGMPDTVIPFAFGKDKAKEIFRKWTKSGLFTPKGFSSQSTLDAVCGIYVPYWLFDYDVSVHMTADATRVRVQRKGDTEYTYTDHFMVERDTFGGFERIPADASQKMPDDTMERLEPFDYSQLKPFDTPYLSGYLAECSNFDPKELAPRTKERAGQYAVNATRDTITGYAGVMVTGTDVRARETKKEYAMLPVWVLTYRWKGKDWKLYLNGQTGRKIGSLPTDKLRVALCYGISSLACSALAALIWGLLL